MTLTRRSLLAALPAVALTQGALAQSYPAPEEIRFDADQPVLGNPKGTHHVVMWHDYQCRFCKAAWPMVQDLIARDPQARVVLKDWAVLGPESLYAAQMTLAAAEMGLYRRAVGALMAAKTNLSNRLIDRTLAANGIDPDTAKATYAANKSKIDGLMARTDDQARRFGFLGTPAWVIGTTIYGGNITEDQLTQALTS